MVVPFTLVNNGRSGCRTGAQVILGGCQPVDNGGAPSDCRPISTAGQGRRLSGRQDKARDAEHTVNGADGEAEPPVLVSVQDEEDDQVGDGRQDDSRGAQSGSAHEELACRDRVAQTGDFAEGQGQCDAMHSVTEVSDLDQTCASQYKDKGEGEVDHDVVG